MNNEEIYKILHRSRNGEKIEDIIDFNQETPEGELTPQKVFELIKDANTCRFCKKELNGDEYFSCKKCTEKELSKYKDKNYILSEKNPWELLILLLIFSQIGGRDKEK